MNFKLMNNKNIIYILIFLCLIFLCNNLFAKQYIIVTESNCTSKDFNLNSTIKNSILAKGVLKEAMNLICYNMSEEEKIALYNFLKQDPLRYILSYNEIEKDNTKENILELRLYIDVEGLKNTLINVGAYLRENNLECKIKVDNFSEDDFIVLSDLLYLTGVIKSDVSNELELNIKKIRESLYTGTLSYKGEIWAGTASSLYNLWEKLWKNYFNLPEIKNRFFYKITVYGGPWVTLSGFRYFDNMLREKKDILENVKLIKIEFNKGIFGQWEIVSINPSKVTSYLNNYFGKREMKFKISLSSPKSLNTQKLP